MKFESVCFSTFCEFAYCGLHIVEVDECGAVKRISKNIADSLIEMNHFKFT